MKKYFLLSLFLLLSLTSFAKVKVPVALLWHGNGVCPVWCGPSAKKAAKAAGFKTIYVSKETKNIDELFEKASIWVQPGGGASTAARDMGSELMGKIRNFIYNGGGYVGFCAGMFLATKKIGTTANDGLGIIPGTTSPLLQDEEDYPRIFSIDLTEHGPRDLYFSGGPFLTLDNSLESNHGTPVGWYEGGKIAAIEATYGQGKIVISGFHPEAPEYWKRFRGVKDRDGNDRFIASEMMLKAKKDY